MGNVGWSVKQTRQLWAFSNVEAADKGGGGVGGVFGRVVMAVASLLSRVRQSGKRDPRLRFVAPLA